MTGKRLLVGFDRERWKRRKAELRKRLKQEHLNACKIQTVTSSEEIEIRNTAYWLNPPALRMKYMRQAEAARKEYPDNEKWIIQQIEELNK